MLRDRLDELERKFDQLEAELEQLREAVSDDIDDGLPSVAEYVAKLEASEAAAVKRMNQAEDAMANLMSEKAQLEAGNEQLREWKQKAIKLLEYAGRQGTIRDAEEWLDAINALRVEDISVALSDEAEE